MNCTTAGHDVDAFTGACNTCEEDRIESVTGARPAPVALQDDMVEFTRQVQQTLKATERHAAGSGGPAKAGPVADWLATATRLRCDKCGSDNHAAERCGATSDGSGGKPRFEMPSFEEGDAEGVAEGRYGPRSEAKPATPEPVTVIRGLGGTPYKAGALVAERFPLDALPPRLRAYTEDVAVRLQVPVDLPALTSLGCISAVCAARLVVRRDTSWTQPLALYAMIAMESGGAKSPAVDEIAEGVVIAQGQLVAAHHDEVRLELESLLKDQETFSASANAKGASKAHQDDMGKKLKETTKKIKALQEEPPPPPRIVIDGDITPERLAGVLAPNKGTGAIIDSEGTFLRHLAGDLYGNGRGGNATIVLKAYDAQFCHPERIGNGRTEPIRRAVLSIVVSPQPAILANVLAHQQLVTNGFVNRFIVCVPGDLVGQRPERQSVYYLNAPSDRPDQGHRQWWGNLLGRLAKLPVIGADTPDGQPIVVDEAAEINLTEQAWKRHVDYDHEFEKRLHPQHPDSPRLKAWGAKHLGRVLRIAALLHLAADRDAGDLIDEDTMGNAIRIGEWTVKHFLAAGPAAGISEGAGRIAEAIESTPGGYLNRAEIGSKVFARHASKQVIDGYVSELVASGQYVTQVQKTGGRPRTWVTKTGVDIPVDGASDAA